MPSRRIMGQVRAKPCARPACIPRSRPRGAKALGLRYERALARALPHGRHGPWYEFIDANGPGYCQPDIVLDMGECMFVLESKLSNVEQAKAQIEDLYVPVLTAAHRTKVHGIIVVRHLTPGVDLALVHDTLQSAMIAAVRGSQLPLLHWLGRGRL